MDSKDLTATVHLKVRRVSQVGSRSVRRGHSKHTKNKGPG